MVDLPISSRLFKERQILCACQINILLLAFGQTKVHVLGSRLELVYIEKQVLPS